jgi:hypothetical protein
MVPSAKNFVSNFSARRHISYNNLLTFNNHDSAHSSSIMGSTRTAPAERLDLQGVYAICQLNQAS